MSWSPIRMSSRGKRNNKGGQMMSGECGTSSRQRLTKPRWAKKQWVQNFMCPVLSLLMFILNWSNLKVLFQHLFMCSSRAKKESIEVVQLRWMSCTWTTTRWLIIKIWHNCSGAGGDRFHYSIDLLLILWCSLIVWKCRWDLEYTWIYVNKEENKLKWSSMKADILWSCLGDRKFHIQWNNMIKCAK